MSVARGPELRRQRGTVRHMHHTSTPKGLGLWGLPIISCRLHQETVPRARAWVRANVHATGMVSHAEQPRGAQRVGYSNSAVLGQLISEFDSHNSSIKPTLLQPRDQYSPVCHKYPPPPHPTTKSYAHLFARTITAALASTSAFVRLSSSRGEPCRNRGQKKQTRRDLPSRQAVTHLHCGANKTY